MEKNATRPTVAEEPRLIVEEALLFPLDDDESIPVMTFRALCVGILEALLGATMTQLFFFKPVHMKIQPLFFQITTFLLGRALALIPGPKWWNPGPFNIKETTIASVISTSASVGAYAVEMLSAEELYFDRHHSFLTSFAILLSSQMIGYGWAGLLQPILVYPAAIVFPDMLPSVALFHSLFGSGKDTADQMTMFKRIFMTTSLYEVLPSYFMPALSAISLPCLVLPKEQIVTNLFGGAQPLEGLGFFELSLDWFLIGSGGPLYTPFIAQIHHIFGVFSAALIFSFAYSHSWFDGGIQQKFPFLSVALHQKNGSFYPVNLIVNQDGSPNLEAIETHGLPYFSSSYVVAQIFGSLALSSAVTHVTLHNWDLLSSMFRQNKSKPALDPHRIVCKKYRDFPRWGFALLSLFSIGLGLGASIWSNSGLPPLGFLVAILLSAVFTLAVGFLNAITGFHLHFSAVVQMLGGLLFRGNVFGNMYFTTASTVVQSVGMLKDLKLGQYMHIPPIFLVTSQCLGTVVGVTVNLIVMRTMLLNQREVLLLPNGNGIFSGFSVAAFEAHSVSWGAFSSKLFLYDQRYFCIPMAIVVGLLLPIPFFVAGKLWPKGKFDLVNVPLLTGSISTGYSGANAGRFVNMAVGMMSQFWARRYHPRLFRKYNYICSAALDGGTQVAILVLSVLFQGTFGLQVKFPNYFLNPGPNTPHDYCHMPRKGHR
ncbi:hypothetical protein CROQUDRAFT_41489 [Cronartium quercuum f. sp. fusiforme G11]|uniref:Uncharacterized protein n=1 Tax=Cronartium quercuum f. sp. fusiforme G11 TaxID=708437 RepID=A0A9P6TF31_9BASI|nr:hypothetical protein CROQUDRAFT_41489 [Cronartium quercuum f. sp. fusiforme G11]